MLLTAKAQLHNPCSLGGSADVGMTTHSHYLRHEGTIDTKYSQTEDSR
jgi:hypothetical protein